MTASVRMRMPCVAMLTLTLLGRCSLSSGHYGNPLPGGSGCTPDEVVLTTMASTSARSVCAATS